MALKEIERFNETVRNDSEMLKDLKNIGTSLSDIVAFANQKGFNFSEDDIKKRQAKHEELSDDDLDEVAGGLVVVAAIQSVSGVGFILLVA